MYDSVSLAIACFFLLLLALYAAEKSDAGRKELVYYQEEVLEETGDERPFASKNGATYTYSWCSGSDRIKPANRVFFMDAEEAERAGKTLSKLCQR